MPITATLAMVASAAMAGVPLLNGFLSKEMFFAEAIETHVRSVLDTALPYVAALASAFAVAYSLRFIHGVFFGPPPTDLPRDAARAAALDARARSSSWCWPASWSASSRRRPSGPSCARPCASVLGARTPDYSLAVWHGFNLPLLMSLLALVGGVAALSRAAATTCSTAPEGPPLLRAPERPAHLRARAGRPVVAMGARRSRRLLGTRRLQPQLRILLLVAVAAALVPLLVGSLGLASAGVRRATSIPLFALVWLVGVGCAVGAA